MFSWIPYTPFLYQLFNRVPSCNEISPCKKHSKATGAVVHKCKLLDKDFHGFCNLREHKRKEHGAQRGSGTRNVDIAYVKVDVDENSLKEELEKGKHFLVENEMKNGRHRAHNFAMDTLDPKYVLEK